LTVAERSSTYSCGIRRGVTDGLLTLPRPSSVVRYRPSLQVDGSCSSVNVAAERQESERLAVNLAVKALSNQCKDAAAVVLANQRRRCCNGWRSATALSAQPVQ
jgi:hypothetical protein